MNRDPLSAFAEVWFCDFEFSAPDGEISSPLCTVAREWRSGKLLRYWRDDLVCRNVAPIPVGPDSLFVAYYSSAELGCFLSLGWPVPVRVLDLYVEFRNATSGLPVQCGHGLLGAMAHFGLDCIDAADKDSMRALAMRGGPYSDYERTALLDYCQSDVDSLIRLLREMLPDIDLPRALLRGRYMAAVASMEKRGIPIDTDRLNRLRGLWPLLKTRLVREVDRDFGVYVPTPACRRVDGGVDDPELPMSFSSAKFAEYLAANDIPWPRLPSGALALSDDVFRQMVKAYPQLAPLRELRHALSEMRLEKLTVGSDGRNRCLLSPFGSKTSRNTPSSVRSIFGPSVWLRGLIRPKAGYAIAYVDWSQQEFGIAAALSGDRAMMEAYSSGDPYLAFAQQAGAVPVGATKESHGAVRDQFKVCALAVQYGMAAKSLAERLNVCEARGRELLQLHRETYPQFWKWSQAAVDCAMLTGQIETVFGWRVHVAAGANPRSLANFPMQSNGSEMLRLACCLATERGIAVCGPIHDALLIEAPESLIDKAVEDCQAAMREASEIVLGGFALRSDYKIVRYPDRYMDARGQRFWDTVWALLGTDATCSASAHPVDKGVAPVRTPLLHQCTPTCSASAHPCNLISPSSLM